MNRRAFGIFKDYGVITIGCLMYALSFNCFFLPNDLAMGGFTGFAQVLHRLIPDLPIGTTVLAMNMPLMTIGVKKQGWSLLFASVYSVFVSSALIDIVDALVVFPAMDPLLACLYGGVVMGAALGLMLRKNATTGGTELAARLLRYLIRSLSIGKLCLIIDVTVVGIYALVFNSMSSAMYGAVAMYVCSIVMDMVVYSSVNAKVAYIISDRCDEITDRLMGMEMGATLLCGRGAYTGNRKNILMCAAKPANIVRIKSVVSAVDPEKSFVIVTDAREVLGEGFGEYSNSSI